MSSPAPQVGCPQFQTSLHQNRREFLRAGVLGAGAAWGLSLPQLLRGESAGAGDRRET